MLVKREPCYLKYIKSKEKDRALCILGKVSLSLLFLKAIIVQSLMPLAPKFLKFNHIVKGLVYVIHKLCQLC